MDKEVLDPHVEETRKIMSFVGSLARVTEFLRFLDELRAGTSSE